MQQQQERKPLLSVEVAIVQCGSSNVGNTPSKFSRSRLPSCRMTIVNAHQSTYKITLADWKQQNKVFLTILATNVLINTEM